MCLLNPPPAFGSLSEEHFECWNISLCQMRRVLKLLQGMSGGCANKRRHNRTPKLDYMVTHQVRDYVLLTFISEFHFAAHMASAQGKGWEWNTESSASRRLDSAGEKRAARWRAAAGRSAAMGERVGYHEVSLVIDIERCFSTQNAPQIVI